MNNTDLVTMIGNLSRSLVEVEALIAGLGYMLGILCMITAIGKLKKVGDARTGSASHEKMFGPVAYFFVGTILIFLPSSIQVFSNTAFGTGGNILQYVTYNPYNIYASMGILIQTAGLIWFVRGCILLVHGSEPGVQEGPKGLMFLIAGVLAINFEYTMGILTSILNGLMNLSKSLM